jgi:multisubunit Na+/H+ antiporter MnhC subunit
MNVLILAAILLTWAILAFFLLEIPQIREAQYEIVSTKDRWGPENL